MAADKMECLLGRQDIPIIQDQPDFVVDLLESNVLLYGASMSGKTNFIKLLITVLHKQYREDAEQIFILDFGGAVRAIKPCKCISLFHNITAFFRNVKWSFYQILPLFSKHTISATLISIE